MTQHLDPRTLVELPDNPRYINDDDFERLCESIKRNPDLFNARPILCSDRTGELVVIGGNQRLKAALRLGLATVPVFVFSGLTVEREREIAVRDNVTNGEWDAAKLESWAECDLVGWGVDIGFDTGVLPEYTPEGDNSVADVNKELERLGLNDKIENFDKGLRKAIQIEFELDDYDEAYKLIQFFREREFPVGKFIIDALKTEKLKI